MAGPMPHKHANCQARASGKDIQLRLKEAKGRELGFVIYMFLPVTLESTAWKPPRLSQHKMLCNPGVRGAYIH